MCSLNEIYENTLAAQSAEGAGTSERRLRIKRPKPRTKLFIAARIWLRVNADAKQPMDMYKEPIRTIPKNVLALVQGSNRLGSPVK